MVCGRPSSKPANPSGWSLRERTTHYRVPGVAIVVLKDGRVVDATGFGVREAGTNDAVDADTLFSVRSARSSPPLPRYVWWPMAGSTSIGTVAEYLNTWQIPAAQEFNDTNVSLRMLMSHTAGFNVHGLEDYLPEEPLPDILDTLNGPTPAKNEPVRFVLEPGSRMRYSGGGITIEQLVLETVAELPLEAIAQKVFVPTEERGTSRIHYRRQPGT